MNKIKIYLGTDEYNNIRYSKEFEIVEELPYIGKTYGDGEYKVIEIIELAKDCEQGFSEAWSYDCYKVIAEDQLEKGDEEYYDLKYYAIEKPEINE